MNIMTKYINWVKIMFVLVYVLHLTSCLDNGAAPKPPMGWSTWNTFECNINEELVRSSADYMASSQLKKAGYEYILIDDCWSSCLKHDSEGNCNNPAPRDANKRLVPDPVKFPSGMKALADYVHSKGLKIGIYTAVSSKTCAGYWGSLAYEHIDAQTFADWDMDFVKHDTCNTDCGIHTGCIQASTAAMRDGLNATGRRIVYYIDDGNDSSGPRVYNPFFNHINQADTIKIAYKPEELAWSWGPSTANMWKSWFDIHDSWESTMDNIHMQIGLAMYQKCGAYNTPDMLTVGQGAMNQGQYRAQMFMWSILGAPLILGNDIRKMDNFSTTLVTAPEVLAVDQDGDCVQASLAHALNGGEVWVKPLRNGTFAIVLLNTLSTAQPITVQLNEKYAHNYGTFYPAKVDKAVIRDLWLQKDLGTFSGTFTATVPAQDAMIIKVTPSK